MGMRVALAKALASGSNSASMWIRASNRPYTVQSKGGYTGSVKIQQSVDDPSVADASATWTAGTALANNDQISIDGPVYRIRVKGDHSAGTADIYMIEDAP